MINSTPPWYSEEAGFFGPHYMKEYTHRLTDERTKAEIGFLEAALELRPEMKILDCPCGHGRHSIELARRGYLVTGVDLNKYFLEQARTAADQENLKINWKQSDMREIPWSSEFDILLNLFSSFGYLESDAEDQKTLNRMAQALKPEGSLVMDVKNRDHMIRNYTEKGFEELPDGSVQLFQQEFDHLTGRCLEKRTSISSDGHRQDFEIRLRLYTAAELNKMFRQAGLTVVGSYGSFQGEPIDFDSRRYILIGQRQESNQL